MIRIGVVIVAGAIIVSMVIALYVFSQYQPNITTVKAGESVIVGPVKYILAFDGTHNGNEKTRPENTFLKIRIIATNIADENTRISGGQFYLIDETGLTHQPIYGGFSEEDLIDDWIEPGKTVSWTTQFDIAYKDEIQYKVGIRPSKQQSSTDIGIVCLTNC